MRTEFGMSAREAWVDTPAWELEALMAQRGVAIQRSEDRAR